MKNLMSDILLKGSRKAILRAALQNGGVLEGADICVIIIGGRESKNIDGWHMERIRLLLYFIPAMSILVGFGALSFNMSEPVVFACVALSFFFIYKAAKTAQIKWLEGVLNEAEKARLSKSALMLHTKETPVFVDLEMLMAPRNLISVDGGVK